MVRNTSPSAYYSALRPFCIRPKTEAYAEKIEKHDLSEQSNTDSVTQELPEGSLPLQSLISQTPSKTNDGAVAPTEPINPNQSPVQLVVPEGMLILNKQEKSPEELKYIKAQHRKINRRDWLFHIIVVVIASIIVTAVATYFANPELSLLDWAHHFGFIK